MSTPGYWRVDGPPPIRPLYGLLQAAEAPAAGVRVVPDTDERGIDRWGNGIVVYPYPTDTGEVTDACAAGSNFHEKGFGDTQVVWPQFNPLTVDVSLTCTTYRVWNHEQWIARSIAVFEAVESAAVARELLTGAKVPANPHFADGSGAMSFPNGDVAVSVKAGLAILEDAIAATARAGLMHVTPGVVTGFRETFAVDNKTGVIRTITGNVVIPDAGYAVSGSHPTGHAAPSATQTWIYATGPIDVRRSEMFVMPEQPSQAVDRGTGGATNGSSNSVTYRVERYYAVDWDTALQAAVLVDRSL